MEGNVEIALMYENMTDRMCSKCSDMPYLVDFSNYLAASHSESTVYVYALSIRRFMESSGKHVGELCLDDYTKYMRQIKSKTPSYQIATYSALKNFSVYLAASKLNEGNPMQYVGRPKFYETNKTIKKREESYLDKSGIEKLLYNVEHYAVDGKASARAKGYHKKWKERDLFIIQILLNTGARCTSLCKLNVDDFDTDNCTLTFTDKGNKTYTCKLSPHVVSTGKKWIEKRESILGGKAEDALFVSENKGRIMRKIVHDLVKKYGSGIIGVGMSPHKLRATFGTQLYNNTKDIMLVKECMHHSNTLVSEKYIRNKDSKNAQIAADIMGSLTIAR